jgi:YebC/PmpR family DNA-binding regulatory protein
MELEGCFAPVLPNRGNWYFSSAHTTRVLSGRFRYKPVIAVRFSTNYLSRDSLKVSVRCGWSPWASQMRRRRAHSPAPLSPHSPRAQGAANLNGAAQQELNALIQRCGTLASDIESALNGLKLDEMAEPWPNGTAYRHTARSCPKELLRLNRPSCDCPAKRRHNAFCSTFSVIYSPGQSAPQPAHLHNLNLVSGIRIFTHSEVPMSGHSKWATIKHKKGALDAKRGKIFTRLIKEITIAAKAGGGDPDGNPRLRTAVLAAKAENMPADNIKRAIQRGTGELEGVNYEEITFEAYGPGGVAIIVEVTTDNRNRTVSEIRHTFAKNGGNLGSTGSVLHMFSKKGLIAVEKSAANEEQLMNIVLEHGGEDLNDEGDTWEIITDPASYDDVLAAVKAAKIPTVMSEVTMIASTYTKLEGAAAAQMLRLIEALEDFDDTQNVYSNFDMDAEQMEQVTG